MKLGIIYVRSRNGVIGKDNAMPWHLPEDLAHFKHATLGCPVIMGRKTWESLPPRFRPLPGRKNIVITRDPQWQAPGAQRAVSLDEAIAACAHADTDTAWITGGAEIFRLAMPRADLAVVTEIGADYDGDTFAPALGADWHEVARERHLSPAGIPFDFVTYRRTAN